MLALRAALARGHDVDETHEGWTALMYAAGSAQSGVDVLALLVEHGADVSAVRKSKRGEDCPLKLAIKSDGLAKVRFLVSAGASLAYRSVAGYDALLDAIYTPKPNLDLFRWLLDHGAPVTGISAHGETALNEAARRGRFDIVKLLLDRGANIDDLQWNALARAVVLGTVADVEDAVREGADRSARDRWKRTPWMLSLELGDVEKAKRLFASGVDRDERGHGDASALAVAAHGGHVELIRWLIEEGFGLEDVDSQDMTPLMRAVAGGHGDAVDSLLRGGADLHARHGGRSATYYAGDRATLQTLLDAGADLADTSESMRRVLRGEARALPAVTRDDFRSGRRPRFGRSNPEVMNVPFWDFMVVSAEHAYVAMKRFAVEGDELHRRPMQNPVWCFSRFGHSIAILPDGSVVEIGGEHEDAYDADFCSYNDVVVHRRDGTFTIYGYPEATFPPTDFHTATRVDGSIYIVGSLGYVGTREHGTTPVYRLDCVSFAIEKVTTTGDCPGWIHRHRARLDGHDLRISGGQVVRRVEDADVFTSNEATFVLDLRTMQWRREP